MDITKLPILWLDLETTGLDIEHGMILEYGLVLTDGIDGPILDKTSIVVRPEFLPLMPPDVVRMHLESGLWQDINEHGVPPFDAKQHVLANIDAWFGKNSTGITVAGSGIDRFDIPWLKWHLPGLVDRFHWRTIDVSGLKHVMQLAGVETPHTGTGHRAVDDCEWANDVARQALDLFRNPPILLPAGYFEPIPADAEAVASAALIRELKNANPAPSVDPAAVAEELMRDLPDATERTL